MIETIVYVAKGIVPIITAIAMPLARKAVDRAINRKSKAINDLEFIAAFLSTDVQYRDRLVVEHAFAAHFKHKFDYDEILAIRRFVNQTKAFCLLKGCRGIVALDSSGKFVFSGTYSDERKRRNRKFLYALLYGALFYIALLPVMFIAEMIKTVGFPFVFPLILWVLAFITASFGVLIVGASIKLGEVLLEEQKKSYVELAEE